METSLDWCLRAKSLSYNKEIRFQRNSCRKARNSWDHCLMISYSIFSKMSHLFEYQKLKTKRIISKWKFKIKIIVFIVLIFPLCLTFDQLNKKWYLNMRKCYLNMRICKRTQKSIESNKIFPNNFFICNEFTFEEFSNFSIDFRVISHCFPDL